MKTFLLAAFMVLVGCGNIQDFTARTYVKYGDFVYDSNKDQNLDTHAQFYPDGKPKDVKIKAIATTPQAAMAMLAEVEKQRMEQFGKLMDALLPILAKFAASAAPVPVPNPAPAPVK